MAHHHHDEALLGTLNQQEGRRSARLQLLPENPAAIPSLVDQSKQTKEKSKVATTSSRKKKNVSEKRTTNKNTTTKKTKQGSRSSSKKTPSTSRKNVTSKKTTNAKRQHEESVLICNEEMSLWKLANLEAVPTGTKEDGNLVDANGASTHVHIESEDKCRSALPIPLPQQHLIQQHLLSYHGISTCTRPMMMAPSTKSTTDGLPDPITASHFAIDPSYQHRTKTNNTGSENVGIFSCASNLSILCSPVRLHNMSTVRTPEEEENEDQQVLDFLNDTDLCPSCIRIENDKDSSLQDQQLLNFLGNILEEDAGTLE